MSQAEFDFDFQQRDVHDIAYNIAQEFENIISFFDSERMNPLIKKVIKVLELLEDCVIKIDSLEKENADLRFKFLEISNERDLDNAEKLSLKKAFEELEETWMQESVALKSSISKLKNENNILQHNLAEKDNLPSFTNDTQNDVIEEQEKFIAKLKINLRQKDEQIQKYIAELESLNLKIEQLMKLNEALHMQYQQTKRLLTSEHFEKSVNEAKAQMQEQKLNSLEIRLRALKKSLQDKVEASLQKPSEFSVQNSFVSEESVNILLEEQQVLKEKVSDLQKELSSVKDQNEELRKKYMTISNNQDENKKGSSNIQKIFRLFLGVHCITSQVCWLRGI